MQGAGPNANEEGSQRSKPKAKEEPGRITRRTGRTEDGKERKRRGKGRKKGKGEGQNQQTENKQGRATREKGGEEKTPRRAKTHNREDKEHKGRETSDKTEAKDTRWGEKATPRNPRHPTSHNQVHNTQKHQAPMEET